MFAYVHYLDDGVKDVVNVKYIKDFAPKNTEDFSAHTYWMKETCEEIENVLATGKRIRVPKLLDKSPPENKTSERKEAKDNAASQKASIEEGKQTFLMDILKKRQALKRKQPLFPPHSTPKREKRIVDDISSESEDELIPKSKFDELDKRYKSLARKYQEAIAEGKELRKLNVELQTCLVAKILSGSNTSPPVIPDLPVTTGCNTATATTALPKTTGCNTPRATNQALPSTTESSPPLDLMKKTQTATEVSSAVDQNSENHEVCEQSSGSVFTSERSVLADAVHVRITTHACDADAGAGQ
ncbi:uncharacterized protein [Chanodichthys erythropterus]|uniref:uncharacterized protein n=1 Tax=Chanodichthys erythropterus TaxID=933992 RepID=UPI00351EF2FA